MAQSSELVLSSLHCIGSYSDSLHGIPRYIRDRVESPVQSQYLVFIRVVLTSGENINLSSKDLFDTMT